MFILLDYFESLNPLIQSLFAGLFTWSITILGAAIVIFKKVNNQLMDALLGLSAGVMLAASFFSLINPAINMAKGLNMALWFVIPIGFLAGCLLLYLGDKVLDKISRNRNITNSSKKRCAMLISSIVIHNIPEGLVIGFAFGSVRYAISGNTFLSALSLAIGIGIQNFPEGSAISLPLRREGFSRKKAFFFGQISGIVEPIAAVLGAFLVLKIKYLLPFMLTFAAGAMIYVVISELIPESQKNNNRNLVNMLTIIGFVLMMVLDISL